MTPQPTLPVETSFTDLEASFIRNSPPGLWPINQDSNLGQLRRVVTDELQARADELSTFFIEMFPASSDIYLDLWEEMLGLPVAPTGKTLSERRAYVNARRRYGAFTWAARNLLIEDLLTATFGQPLEITPEGLPLDAGGLPLQGETLTLTQLYRVYEDIRNFAYKVRISSSNAVDVARLTQSLARMSPAGADTFTIENTLAQILHYKEMVISDNPSLYIKMGDTPITDQSGFGHTVTTTSAPTLIASPGLVHLSILGNDGARDFDGTDDRLEVPDSVILDFEQAQTIEAWVRPDALPGGGSSMVLATKGTNAIWVDVDASGFVRLWKGGASQIAISSVALSTGTTYHVVAVKTHDNSYIYINGVDRTGTRTETPLSASSSPLSIASSLTPDRYWNGAIDEFALYDYALSADKVLEHYRTGIGLV